ncbi:trypsin-like serine protease [Hyphomicrobium sp. xq]|uniref:Trypsin-like serine protease n=1 Tax=Hyphomicrobium album TaxID=2665159 RepID=A0A6I3KQ86_9HYPH|nr:trypsin-like serine protease [Hyphomicrobium album]
MDGERGLIVTCAHQITDADAIKVTLSDGRELTAEQLARDIETDVAVLKVAADNLVSIRFADSSKVHVGDFVVSVGNPFGIGQSISFGVVSALRRSNMPIEGYDNLIQTDASMNPGDSGGALVNLNGELVGLDTAIVGLTGSNVGIGFAMPGNMVRLIAGELIAHGEVRRGHLGVALRDLDSEIASVARAGASAKWCAHHHGQRRLAGGPCRHRGGGCHNDSRSRKRRHNARGAH